MRKVIAALIVLALVSTAMADIDIATALMRSTFKVAGKGSGGTAFLLGRPVPSKNKQLRYVLVTAAHVFEHVQGDTVVLNLRKKQGEVYTRLPHIIAIKRNGKPLWKKHPQADVAVMYVSLPKEADIVLLPATFLATDETLKKFEVKPSDQLFALGFPMGQESNTAGFPILRTGTIASYPLTPTKDTKTLLFDFEVYKGNSGGPVFLRSENRVYAGGTHTGVVRLLIGLVSKERSVEEHIKGLWETSKKTHTLKIAEVVHAALIKEAIDMLPGN